MSSVFLHFIVLSVQGNVRLKAKTSVTLTGELGNSKPLVKL
jgi:hypothetical protein